MNTQIHGISRNDDAIRKPFRLAIVGCGGIARHHMKYLSKFPEVEVVACCDINAEALHDFQKQHQIERGYEDYKTMLREFSQTKLDAVDVCTPNGIHAPATIAALEAGFHVLVEKPPAMNAEEAQTMVMAARKNKRELVIGFQHRFEPRSKVLRDQIASGAFGKILYVRAQALRRRGIPNWGVFGQKALQGGGPMIDVGVHILETAHNIIGNPTPVSATGNTFTFLGDKPSSVICNFPNWDWQTYTVEDMAVGMIRFDTGTMLTIESSFVAHIEKDIFNIQIFGEKGGAWWDTSQMYFDHNNLMFDAKPACIGNWDMWDYKIQHFIEVCRDGRENESPGEHGLMVQKMLDGVYKSASAGREVAIN